MTGRLLCDGQLESSTGNKRAVYLKSLRPKTELLSNSGIYQSNINAFFGLIPTYNISYFSLRDLNDKIS